MTAWKDKQMVGWRKRMLISTSKVKCKCKKLMMQVRFLPLPLFHNIYNKMKKCNKCGQVKILTDYSKDKHNKDGFTYKCKLCCKEDKKEWNQSNEKQVKEYNKQYAVQTKEKRKKYNMLNKEKHVQYVKLNKEKNKEYNKKWLYKKLKTDPKFKLIHNLRIRLYQILGSGRSKHTIEVLGCSAEEFKQHLEKQFEPWMNWDNMAKRIIPGINMVWDVDHIIPMSSAKTEEEVYKLSHYTNFQPLCAYNNRWIKRDKI